MTKRADDIYGSLPSRELSLEKLFRVFSEKGVNRVYVKPLAPNDNSKNQIYLGGDFSAINIIPVQSLETFAPASQKEKLKPGKKLVRGKVNFKWIDYEGSVYDAPDTKLILYPQYPEVRLSGFLQGSRINLSTWMDVKKSGRAEGRYLLLGIHPCGDCYAFLAVPASQVACDLEKISNHEMVGMLRELAIGESPEVSSKVLLIRELRRIHKASPIEGKKLDRKSGMPQRYKAPNGAGFTLEAELGIFPNGRAEPDYKGWEVKAHGNPVVTLMTPEPSGGIYQDKGIDFFIREYGYPDRNNKPDRLNFGGVHKVGERHHLTNLLMEIKGFDADEREIDVSGGLYLTDPVGCVAAEWSFTKLLEHWNRKHAKVAYVPYKRSEIDMMNWYDYGTMVGFGEGTDFLKFMENLHKKIVCYDPGIKLVGASKAKPEIKRRNQFRINYTQMERLYESWNEFDIFADT